MRLFIKPDSGNKDYYLTHKAAYKGDSGIDLFCPEPVKCLAERTTVIDLGISCMMTCDNADNCVSYLVYPRSSISKTPLILHNSVGVIDSQYRNTIKIALYNTSKLDYVIAKGDRLVQICSADLKEINITVVETLPQTNRGSGFGSSGKNHKDLPVDKNIKGGFIDRFKSIFS